MRYIAREGGNGTWWVEDTEMLTSSALPLVRNTEVASTTEVAATYWGWVHPDPKGAAEAEAKLLNKKVST